jgi:7-cyano-7-deazaguanine reductase
MKISQSEHLTALGSGSTVYTYQEPSLSILEYFPNPAWPEGSVSGIGSPALQEIEIRAPEFTSLCPKTGQPDFACIVVRYQPAMRCVESKSLKLYLGAYRMVGEFHEACVWRIGTDLVLLLDPVWLEVVGEFTPRGGISFWPKFYYRRDEHAGR